MRVAREIAWRSDARAPLPASRKTKWLALAIRHLPQGLTRRIIKAIKAINARTARGSYTYAFDTATTTPTYHEHMVSPCTSLAFEGYPFPAPADTPAYLESLYGADFNTPKEVAAHTRRLWSCE